MLFGLCSFTISELCVHGCYILCSLFELVLFSHHMTYPRYVPIVVMRAPPLQPSAHANDHFVYLLEKHMPPVDMTQEAA